MHQNIAFAGPRQMDMVGNFFAYYSSTTAALGIDDRIRVYAENQLVGELKPGDQVTLPRMASFWVIEPLDAGAAGVVMIGDGSAFRTDRMIGQVEVVDGMVSRVLQGRECFSYQDRVNTAGHYAHIAVIATGLYRVAVRGFHLSAGGVSKAQARYITTTPTDLAGANGTPINVLTARIRSLGYTNPEAKSYAWTETLLNAPANVPTGYSLGKWAIPNNTTVPCRFPEPFILEPGEGILLSNYTAAQDFGVLFDLSSLAP